MLFRVSCCYSYYFVSCIEPSTLHASFHLILSSILQMRIVKFTVVQQLDFNRKTRANIQTQVCLLNPSPNIYANFPQTRLPGYIMENSHVFALMTFILNYTRDNFQMKDNSTECILFKPSNCDIQTSGVPRNILQVLEYFFPYRIVNFEKL